MSTQICLKWNSFLNNIATSFESLWEEEGLVDVTLTSDGQCLTAHKVILSASSPFFKKVFQTNPCQHPVIILQDVHFSELEALLIFIYKGEVNIEQKNLPALLKAAETLQIRGLSGSDVFASESYKRLAEFEDEDNSDNGSQVPEESSRKKLKVSKNNSILEKALGNRSPINEDVNESDNTESKAIVPSPEHEPITQLFQPLEMKVEPLDTKLEEEPKSPPSSTDLLETSNQDQTEESHGLPKLASRVITKTCHSSSSLYTSQYRLAGPDVRETRISTPNVVDNSLLPHSSRTEDHCETTDRFFKPSSLTCRSSELTFPPFTNPDLDFLKETQSLKGPSYPPFPCPFCDRAYTSWGFRRRHIKAVHTISPKLNCKWCLVVLPSHAAWRRHVISAHNLSASDAHNGLLILEEAHMVLQNAHPTRLDTLVNIIKQNSQHVSDGEAQSTNTQQD